MTGRPMLVTDDTLRRALIELAGQPDADVLLSEVIRAVEATPQVRGRPWHVPRWERGALLVAAIVATLGIGAAIALSLPQPDPQPTPAPSTTDLVTDLVPNFAIPFRYVVPEGQTATFGTRDGQLPAEAMQVLSGRWGTLTIFLVTGSIHTCEADPATPGGVITRSLSRDPTRFLEQLRADVGVGIGPIHQTMLGNLPAVEAGIDSSAGTCSDAQIHEDRLGLGAAALEPTLRGPSTLIVAESQGTTIGVLIAAGTEAAHAEWLPVAREYVDSFVFQPDTDD